jgi:hypothetical protein
VQRTAVDGDRIVLFEADLAEPATLPDAGVLAASWPSGSAS